MYFYAFIAHVCENISPPLSQSIVTKVKDELMKRIRLNFSDLFLLFLYHNHGGFLQEEPQKL